MTKKPKSDDIFRLFGPITDQVVVDILEVDASFNELEEVALRLAQEDDVLGEMRRPLTGAAAQIYDILMSIEDFRDERNSGRGPGG
ncbi:MAG: hypothetical protein GY789_10070 [Hyphomicrobiales bacterium]|nr:hypothetical protein [Hyphomicrobiales bacterium]MCP5000724.1 hypothetical protein [Hyphomicrobiales bacterium]